MRCVVFMSDFGLRDPYVGVMKGAFMRWLERCGPIDGDSALVPVLLDFTHEVGDYDILRGAVMLWRCLRWYPAGSVFCCVVDPGVGSSRRCLACRIDEGRVLVGPDNGLLWLAVSGSSSVSAAVFEPDRPPRDATFHGRDLFSRAAALLCRSDEFPPPQGCSSSLGLRFRPFPVERMARVDYPGPIEILPGREWKGGVLWADSFGNIVTSFERERFESLFSGGVTVGVGRLSADGVYRCYSEMEDDGVHALWNSYGLLELAVRRGSALSALGAADVKGLEVVVRVDSGEGAGRDER